MLFANIDIGLFLCCLSVLPLSCRSIQLPQSCFCLKLAALETLCLEMQVTVALHEIYSHNIAKKFVWVLFFF